ncbi:hypothetical protein ACV334_33310, partial [Pseudomonas aeruginosa]
ARGAGEQPDIRPGVADREIADAVAETVQGAAEDAGGPAGVFSGTLDGLGNSIGNLSISNTGPNVGLFARSSGTLSNL